jgi:hypothetical protein
MSVNAASAVTVTVNDRYYPGSVARMEADSVPVSLTPSPAGLLRLSIPPASHSVLLTLEAEAEDRTGQLASGITATLLLFSGVRWTHARSWFTQLEAWNKKYETSLSAFG